MNGLSTATSSVITNAAGENVAVSPVTPSLMDGFPSRLADSTIRWGGGLPVHQEIREPEGEEGDSVSLAGEQVPQTQLEPQKKPITPSLATLEKAVAARIYFENLYFPLLRQPPSREQRRLAMEKDMMEMRLSEVQKEQLRSRWRQNETDYLREQRRKIDVSTFVKLKTIGHGLFVSSNHEAPNSRLIS
jgi:protein-serine/threonine kinase